MQQKSPFNSFNIDQIKLVSPYVLKKTDEKENQLPGPVQRLLQARKKGQLRISFGRWKELKMHIYSGRIEELNCFCIQLIQNNHPSILQELSLIKLKKLRVLNLCDNAITSIEVLSKMEMPHLEQIHLEQNKISEIRNIRKLTTSALYFHTLTLTNNPIKEIEGLSQLNSENLSLLTFSEFAWSQRYVDIKPIAKLQSKLMKNLNVRTYYRLSEQLMVKRMVQRWPKFSVISPKLGRIRFEEDA